LILGLCELFHIQPSAFSSKRYFVCSCRPLSIICAICSWPSATFVQLRLGRWKDIDRVAVFTGARIGHAHVAVLLGVAGDAIGLAAPGAEGDEPDQQRGLACLAAQVIHVAGTTRAALNDDPMDVRMRNV
jgi:hypothetical protein